MHSFLHTGDDGAAKAPRAFLELAYPIPRDTVSLDDFARRRHHDLPHLSDEDLAFDGYRVLLRLCFERDPSALDWLRERRRAVRAEMARRGARDHAGGSSAPRPDASWSRERPTVAAAHSGARGDRSVALP